MKPFSFELKNEASYIIEKIDWLIAHNANKNGPFSLSFKSGFCFSRLGNYIGGFYVSEDDEETTEHSNPIRAFFIGKVFFKKNVSLYKGIIFPEPLIFFLLIGAIVYSIILKKFILLLLGIPIVLIFFLGYAKLINETYEELKNIFPVNDNN